MILLQETNTSDVVTTGHVAAQHSFVLLAHPNVEMKPIIRLLRTIETIESEQWRIQDLYYCTDARFPSKYSERDLCKPIAGYRMI